MATISSPGIGSGLDVRSIITQLMAIERQPKDKLAADATKIQTQISEVGKISSAVAKLRDLSAKLSASSFWQQTSAASSNAAVSVSTNSNALAAAYAVQVQQLASAQSLVAGHTFAASTAAVGSGTLTLELGTWGTGQSSFAPRLPASAASSVDINVLATDTVETLRDKINASGAAVAASVMTDATGARLVLRSKETGLSNGFRVQTSGATGALASLGYDPSSGVTAATQTTAAANALATIDGVASARPVPSEPRAWSTPTRVAWTPNPSTVNTPHVTVRIVRACLVQ